MAALTVQGPISLSGVTPSYASAAGGGDTFINNGDTFFHVKNGSGGALTVTFTAQGTYKGVALEDVAVSVGAGSEEMVGPFDPEIFNNANGAVAVSYSGVTSLTVAAIRFQ